MDRWIEDDAFEDPVCCNGGGGACRGIPSLPWPPPGAEDLDSELELLARLSGLTEGVLKRQFDALCKAYTAAVRWTHPERGGSQEAFRQVHRASKRVAKACHGREI